MVDGDGPVIATLEALRKRDLVLDTDEGDTPADFISHALQRVDAQVGPLPAGCAIEIACDEEGYTSGFGEEIWGWASGNDDKRPPYWVIACREHSFTFAQRFFEGFYDADLAEWISGLFTMFGHLFVVGPSEYDGFVERDFWMGERDEQMVVEDQAAAGEKYEGPTRKDFEALVPEALRLRPVLGPPKHILGMLDRLRTGRFSRHRQVNRRLYDAVHPLFRYDGSMTIRAVSRGVRGVIGSGSDPLTPFWFGWGTNDMIIQAFDSWFECIQQSGTMSAASIIVDVQHPEAIDTLRDAAIILNVLKEIHSISEEVAES